MWAKSKLDRKQTTAKNGTTSRRQHKVFNNGNSKGIHLTCQAVSFPKVGRNLTETIKHRSFIPTSYKK